MPPITDSRIEEYLHARGALDRVARSRVVPDEEIGLVNFDRVWLSSPYFFPITADGHGFMHFFGMFAANKYTTLYAAALREQIMAHAALLDEPGCTRDVFVLGGSDIYYHWLMDFLPRLFWLAQSPALRNLPLIVDHAPAGFEQDSLASIFAAQGWPPPRLIAAPGLALFPLREARVPSRIGRASAIEIVTKQLYPVRPIAGASRKLFIRRERVQYRRLVNQAEIEAMLVDVGFESIDPGGLSFAAQAALFAQAAIIVGAHGAALTNALFAPAGSTLVELWSGLKQPHYDDIARLKGLRYRAVEGVSIPGTHERPQHRDFHVGVDALREALTMD